MGSKENILQSLHQKETNRPQKSLAGMQQLPLPCGGLPLAGRFMLPSSGWGLPQKERMEAAPTSGPGSGLLFFTPAATSD